MKKMYDSEIANIVALKHAGLETSAQEAWMVFLKKGNSTAYFAYDPQAGMVAAQGQGEFSAWRDVHVKVLAKAGAPGKFTVVLFATTKEDVVVEGYRIGENKALEPVYALLVFGQEKRVVTATVIERSDGKPVHQLCTTYTHESARQLDDLLATVGFLAATTLSDVRALLKDGGADRV